jgi:hypothetical protein
MNTHGYHLQLRLRDGGIITTIPEQMRLVSRLVFEKARDYNLLAYGLSDTHLHLLVLCALAACSLLAHHLEASLKLRLGLKVGFEKFSLRAVRDNWHLYQAFRYVLTQYLRHNLDWAFVHEGSSLPDLLGLRLVGGYTFPAVRAHLPRLQRATLVNWMGIDSLAPADGPAHAVLEAALSAACLSSFAGSTREAIEARRAVAQMLNGHVPQAQLATDLGISRRSLRWLREQPADPALVRAIRLQLGLRAAREACLRREALGDRVSAPGEWPHVRGPWPH